jgi:selenide,water dikinase
VIPVKPVSGFHRHWSRLEAGLRDAAGQPRRLAVVGGGAGSVELALAMRHRLPAHAATITLVCGGGLLEGYSSGAVRHVRRACAAAGVEVREQAMVTAVQAAGMQLGDGDVLPCDEVFWCTSARGADWLTGTGLPLDERGFLEVQDTLQVRGQDNIFAAGDVATQVSDPRPKAGVYAVRQAPLLAHNLSALLQGRPLRRFRPQRRFLSLLSLGDRRAVADRGWWWAAGAWVWRWKDRIDRRFMARFTELPDAMPEPPPGEEPLLYCGGCGAKLPAELLRRTLARLGDEFPATVNPDNFNDDAAEIRLTPGARLVQSIDVLRSLLPDPWVMGRVAALHALSDLYAMGAQPHSALASISLPHDGAALQERDLYQLLAGALWELDRAGCALVGGHSTDSAELSIGFAVNGEVPATGALAKLGARPGDRLVLTKPIGTGVLFAAGMRGIAEGQWLQRAQQVMLQSNAVAARVASDCAASACTDVTGFGVAGHLAEMLGEAQLEAVLDPAALPLLPGVEACFTGGVESTLQAANRQSVRLRLEGGLSEADARVKVTCDPQTCGGLLIAIGPERLQELLEALRQGGFPESAAVGRIDVPADVADTGAVRLLNDA